jgi:hypothetical protein
MSCRGFFSVLLSFLVMSGCAAKKAPINADFSPADADGSWTHPCDTAIFIQGTYHASESLTVQDGTYQRVTTYWSDANCTTSVFELTQSGTFSVGGSRDAQTRDATIVATKTTGKTADGTIASALNDLQTCQINTWVAGASQDETNTPCNTISNWGRHIDGIQIAPSGGHSVLTLVGSGATPGDTLDTYQK